MDFLRRIEDDINELKSSTKSRYPTIALAAEQAKNALQSIKQLYVAEVMKKSKMDGSVPSLVMFRSADVCSPYVIACNTANLPAKMVLAALSGIQMLLDFGVVPSDYAPNVIMALRGAATVNQSSLGSSLSEVQMKVLQIELQLLNFLATDEALPKLNESTTNSFLSLALQLAGDSGSSTSVTSTAFVTLKQTINVLMDYISESQANGMVQDNDIFTCVTLLLIDLSHVLKGKSPAWLHGVDISFSGSLDLLINIVCGWSALFKLLPELGYVLKTAIVPGLISQLKSLQEDFIAHAKTMTSSGAWGTIPSSETLTVKVVKLARFIVMEFLESDFAADVENVAALLLHALRAEAGIEARLAISIDERGEMKGHEVPAATTATGTLVGNVAAGVGIAGSLIQRFNPLAQASSGTRQRIYFLEVADSSNNFGAEADPSFVPCYPSLLCLEAMLAFFLQKNLVRKLSQTDEGMNTFTIVSISTLEMLSLLLKEGLGVEGNDVEMASVHKSSELVKMVESLVLGAADYADGRGGGESGFGSLQDLTIASQFVTPGEVLAVAFFLVQIIVRLLVECALLCHNSHHEEVRHGSSSNARPSCTLFISSSYLNAIPLAFDAGRETAVRQALKTIFERTFDGVQDVCLMLLSYGVDETVLKRGLGIVSELAIGMGVLGQRRACDLAVATLCKCAVPRWHGESALPVSPERSPRSHSRSASSPSADMEPTSPPDVMQWRHLQSVVRLVQVVHILADCITEWETILDTFEQLSEAVREDRDNVRHEISSSDLELIGDCLERFKAYSTYLSDGQLFGTMTSFVAVSLNSLGTIASGQGEESRSRGANSPRPSHPGGDVKQGWHMSFSLEAMLDMVKMNAYRVSVVWQLVTSQLKMMASLKHWKSRQFAVKGTLDITMALLIHMNSQDKMPSLEYVKDVGVSASTTRTAAIFLSDDRLFNHIMPSLKTAFVGRPLHREVLQEHMSLVDERPRLTQSDLLATLRVLGAVPVDDVKTDVIFGLFNMLQDGGEAIKGGWSAVVDLIAAVPMSMCPAHSEEWSFSSGMNADSYTSAVQEPWPRDTLDIAFSSMKLVVDDFLGFLDDSLFKDIIVCLSIFGAQDIDVNISLTAVEMLWKVVDFVMSIGNDQLETSQKIEILDLTMMRLLSLSQDQRPEIRNCATNTLFTSMVANTALFSSVHWKRAFDQIIFKLFTLAREKSSDAMRSKEEAMAPELKRGVKMTVHHSRDTAHKQWSETRVLALRGLARIIRACTKVLVCETWFRKAWGDVLSLCVADVRASEDEMEVALAGLDVIFAMLKMVSTHTYVNRQARGAKGMRVVDGAVVSMNAVGSESSLDDVNIDVSDKTVLLAREELWQLAWSAIGEATCVPNYSTSVSLHIVTNLNDLYTGGMESEFKNSENIRRLLEFVVTVARARGRDVNAARGGQSSPSPMQNRVSLMQLQHAVADLIRHVEPTTLTGYSVLTSALAEISFSSCPSDARYDAHSPDIVTLGAIPEKLRGDAAKYLRAVYVSSVSDAGEREKMAELFDVKEEEDEASRVSLPDDMVSKYPSIVVGHFVSWQCAGLLAKRRSLAGDVAKNRAVSPVGAVDVAAETSGWFGFSYSTDQSPVKVAKGDGETAVNNGNNVRESSCEEGSANGDDEVELMTVRSFEVVPHVVGKMKTSANSDDAVPDEDSDQSWRFHVLPLSSEELMLIASTMSIFLSKPLLNEGEGRQNLPDSLSRRILISLASVMSPWRSTELSSAKPDSQDFSQLRNLTGDVLDLFTSAVVNGRFSCGLCYNFVKITVVLTRLLLRAVCLCDLHVGEEGHSPAERDYFKDQMILCISVLTRLLGESSLSRTVSVAIVGGMVEIGRDLLNVVASPTPPSKDLIAACESHCATLLTIKCSTGDLSGDVDTADFQLDPTSLMAAFACELLDSVGATAPAMSLTSSSSDGEQEDGDGRAHLLLLLPLVLSACNSDSSAIRTLGRSLMGHIDLLSFLNSFNTMRGRVRSLERRNEELQDEVMRLQATASLPY